MLATKNQTMEAAKFKCTKAYYF